MGNARSQHDCLVRERAFATASDEKHARCAADLVDATAQVVALSSTWATYLGQWHWTWFATLTFRTNVHPEAADRVFRVWISKLNRKMAGHRWHKHPERAIWWARASEPQRSGRLHFHALMGAQDLHNMNRLEAMGSWEKLGCCANAKACRCARKSGPGFARIEEPRDMGAAVCAYCSKYVSKGGQIDLGGPIVGSQHALRTRQLGVSDLPPVDVRLREATPRDFR